MKDFLKSSVGRKYIMGLTGLVWVGFLFAHMAPNMLILFSAELYNAYTYSVTANKILLYAVEAILLSSLVIHVLMAILLTRQNRVARGAQYAVSANGEKAVSWGSRYMAAQGSAILAFIILHLITFKYGTYYETTVNGVVMRDMHRLVVEVFQSPAYVAWYFICLGLMVFHVSHGAASVFQSFGILERKLQGGIKKFAWVYAIVIVTGFLSQPVYVFLFHK